MTKGTTMLSRVVPGTLETITRLWPSSLLMNDDLPTFGRPATTTLSASVVSGGAPGGRCGRAALISSPMPRLCSAETG